MIPDKSSADASCGNPLGGGWTQETLYCYGVKPRTSMARIARSTARMLAHTSGVHLSTVGPRSGKKMGEWGTETTRQLRFGYGGELVRGEE